MTRSATRPTQAEINQSILAVDHLTVGLGGRTARGAAIVMASQFIRIGIQLVTTFFLARLLVPGDFGLVAIGYTILALLTLFTDLGLTSVTVQTKNLDQDTASALFYINITLGFIAVLLVTLSSPLLVWFFRDDRIALVAIGLAVSTPINALGSQHQALLMRNMQWARLQTRSLIALVVGSVVAILCAWLLDLGYWALVVQATATAVAGLCASWISCPWRPSIVRKWAGVRAALGTSLNLSGSMIMGYLHRQTDQLLIGWRWGPTELGFYARSYSLLMMPLNLVTGPLTSAIIPALSRLQDDPQRWRQAYLDALILVTALGGALAAVLFGAAGPIIEIVLGPGWEKSEQVFSCLVLAMLAATPMNTVTWIYISLGRSRRMLMWGLIGTTAYVASFLIGLPYGGVGVALAYGLAQISAFAPCLWMATRRTSVTLVDVLKAVLPLMLTTVVVGLSLRFVTSQVGLFLGLVAAVLAGLIYVGLFALICWNWPPHRRVRDRGLVALGALLTRLRLPDPNSSRVV